MILVKMLVKARPTMASLHPGNLANRQTTTTGATMKQAATPKAQAMAESQADLKALVQPIEDAHQAATASVAEGLHHAILCGEKLVQAKARCKEAKEQWLPWIKKNCSFSEKTAQNYMRLALNKHLPKLKEVGVRKALAMLAKKHDEKKKNKTATPPTPPTPKPLQPATAKPLETVIQWLLSKDQAYADTVIDALAKNADLCKVLRSCLVSADAKRYATAAA
jgi:hypothetical protein